MIWSDFMKKKMVVTSLFGDPLHEGHIECLQEAKKLGDILVVLVDSDAKAIIKKGFVFMPLKTRVAIISALECVDYVIPIDVSVAEVLEILRPQVFCKGGDRTIDNLPQCELDVCRKYNIEIVCGLGEKVESSSNILENFYQNYKKIKESQNGKE
jgi:D-beta-D-heptose 7-phosphate kinase/D-beta-D-heptose 1-phosphate adenosyltransferase